MLVAGIAVVAIVVAGLGLVALASAPSHPSTNVRPTASPLGGSPSGGPTGASPTPSPSLDPGIAIRANFWALVSSPTSSYHMTAHGRSTFDGHTYETFDQSVDVVGDEYSGTISSRGPGPLLQAIQPSNIRSARIARVAGVIYLLEAGKSLTKYRSSARSDRLTPFLYIDPIGALDYVGPLTVDGRHLYLLRSNAFYRPDIARLIDTARFDVDPDTMRMDILVTAEGIPVKATFSVVVRGNDQIGKQHTFRARTDFAFVKVGAKLTVRIPKR
jgi:hypothetical protein